MVSRSIGFGMSVLAVCAASAAVVASEATGSFVPSPGFRGLIQLAAHPVVQKEIDLSDPDCERAKTLLQELGQEQQLEISRSDLSVDFSELQNLTGEPRVKKQRLIEGKFAALNRDVEGKLRPKLEKILSPRQLERVRQIRWQSLGMKALSDPELATALELTDDQQTRVATLIAQASDEEHGQFREKRKYTPAELQAIKQKTAEIAKDRDARLSKVLDDGQTIKLADLTGAAFDLEKLDAKP